MAGIFFKKKCGGHFTRAHYLLSRVLGVGSCITILRASYSFASVTGACGVGDVWRERRRVDFQKNQNSPSLEHIKVKFLYIFTNFFIFFFFFFVLKFS
jgi:hypothetical protein